jgi:hypothetical protein
VRRDVVHINDLGEKVSASLALAYRQRLQIGDLDPDVGVGDLGRLPRVRGDNENVLMLKLGHVDTSDQQ